MNLIKYKLCFILTLTISIQFFATSGYTQCETELVKFYKKVKTLRDTIIILEDKNSTIAAENQRLLQQLSLESQSKNELASENSSLNQQLDQYRADIAEINRLRRANRALRKEKENLNLALALKTDSIHQKQLEIKSLLVTQGQIQGELDYANSTIDCINDYQERRATAKVEARDELKKANLAFDYYIQHARDKRVDFSIKRDTISYAWNLYQQYGVSTHDITCNGIPQSHLDDHMTPLEHYYAAKILTFTDKSNLPVLNSLGENGKDRLNKITELLLVEVGKAYSKNDYDGMSANNKLTTELSAFLQQLPFFIFPERKNSADTTNLYATNEIKNIFSDYSSTNFSSALNQFNKYYPILEMDGIKEDSIAILNAKYAVATILLYDRGAISQNEDLLVKGSWLYNNFAQREVIAREMLQEFIDKTEDEHLKREAIISLNKFYKPKQKPPKI